MAPLNFSGTFEYPLLVEEEDFKNILYLVVHQSYIFTTTVISLILS
jgi:hypothetical protein